MTVERRLTLAFIGVLAALVVVLGAVEAAQLQVFLADSVATRLRAQARPVIDARVPQIESLGLADVADALATDLTSADTGALVFDEEQRVVGRRAAGTIGADLRVEIPRSALGRALGGEREVDVIVEGVGGERVFVALVPTPPRAPHTGVIALGTGVAEEDTTLRRQLLLTAVNVMIAVVVGALVGPWLIRRQLRPLRRIASTTEGIAGGDLSLRSGYAGPADEIGLLARSVDGMADELERAFDGLARSEARMRTFVAEASHELRTPLTALGGFADVLLRGGARDDPEASARLLAGLRREVSRMQRLVDDLLTLARLDAGAPLRRAPVDLHALTESVLEQFRPLAAGRGLAVDSTVAVVVEADADRLRQVLLNLVGNAVRHTGDDGSITVRLARTDGAAVLEVIDDGEGMDAEVRARAFDRFVRGLEGSGRSGGAGLGLAIVAGIVAAHGGTVSLESARGRGTSVRVVVPGYASPSRPPPAVGVERTT